MGQPFDPKRAFFYGQFVQAAYTMFRNQNPDLAQSRLRIHLRIWRHGKRLVPRRKPVHTDFAVSQTNIYVYAPSMLTS